MKLIKPTRRLFLKKAALAAPALITSPRLVEAFWQSRDSNYNKNIAGGGALIPTTWDNGDKTGITLDGTFLVATNNTGSLAGVRSLDAITGKVYFEIVWTTYLGSPGDGHMAIGLANKTAGLTTGILSQVDCAGHRDDSQLLYHFVGPSIAMNTGSGDNVGVAIDVPNKKMWVRKNGGAWVGGTSPDPETNTAGLDWTGITGTVYAFHQSDSFSYASTAKFDPASWTYNATKPPSFGVLGH